MEAIADDELVRQTLTGRKTAYEELARRWAPRVLALCHARVGRHGAADDLAQETLLRGFRALKTLAEPAKFGAWLAGIAARACLDWLKAKERTQVNFSALDGGVRPEDRFPAPAVEDGLERKDEVQRLLREVESLPAECREVLMLFYYQELCYRDMAQLLEVSPATVNARLTRARALLRERLNRSRR